MSDRISLATYPLTSKMEDQVKNLTKIEYLQHMSVNMKVPLLTSHPVDSVWSIYSSMELQHNIAFGYCKMERTELKTAEIINAT